MDKIIKNPINDIRKLRERQSVYFEVFNYQLQTLKNTEKDLLWIMTLKKDIDIYINMASLIRQSNLTNLQLLTNLLVFLVIF